MELAPIITRIQASVPALKSIEGAAALAAIKDTGGPRVMPAAFIFPIAETAAPNNSGMSVVQMVTERFGVIIVVRDLKDPRGAAAFDAGLTPLRDSIRGALLGWAPDAARAVITRGNSNLLNMINGSIWWQDEYTTGRQDRSV